MNQDKQAYGFGIVGLGAIGPLHVQAIAATAGAKLVAVMDSDPVRLAEASDK